MQFIQLKLQSTMPQSDSQTTDSQPSKDNSQVGTQPAEPGEGPKFYVDIEGETYPWDEDEITVPEIIELGDLPPEKGVLLIDLRTQEQETLDEDEVVELKPGMGFSQKFRFKRGVVIRG